MSFEDIVAIISLLLQAIGILVTLRENNESHENLNVESKRGNNLTKKIKEKFEILKRRFKK